MSDNIEFKKIRRIIKEEIVYSHEDETFSSEIRPFSHDCIERFGWHVEAKGVDIELPESEKYTVEPDVIEDAFIKVTGEVTTLEQARTLVLLGRCYLSDIINVSTGKMCDVPEGVYRHYKGGTYLVVGVETDSETLEDRVQYVSMSDGKKWSRPASMWNDMVKIGDAIVPRFKKVEITESREIP